MPMSPSKTDDGEVKVAEYSKISLPLVALVVAGGLSRRMGQDKALLTWQGIPLLRRVCEAALACTSQVYVVTPWPDRYRPILPVPCQFIPETLPPDAAEAGSPGPLIGFAQGLTWLHTHAPPQPSPLDQGDQETPSQEFWVLLLACDLPCLDPERLRTWVNQLPQVAETAIAYLPPNAKGWEPLCGFYRSSCLKALHAFIQAGGRSFQTWLATHPVDPILDCPPPMVFNCNTPDALHITQQVLEPPSCTPN